MGWYNGVLAYARSNKGQIMQTTKEFLQKVLDDWGDHLDDLGAQPRQNRKLEPMDDDIAMAMQIILGQAYQRGDVEGNAGSTYHYADMTTISYEQATEVDTLLFDFLQGCYDATFPST